MIRWYRIIGVVASYDPFKPSADVGYWIVHSVSQLLPDGAQRCAHSIATSSPKKQELVVTRPTADVDEAEKRKRFRFSQTPSSASFGRESAKLDDARFLRMHLERELLQSLAEFSVKRGGIALILETDDDIIGISDEDDIASGMALPPLVRPKVEGVMKVDVSEQRRDNRALRGSLRCCGQRRPIHDTGSKPLVNHSKYALVADSMFEETY